ncbi:SLAM family member 9-like isoform X2 [Petaurus breviceps papuanus]|uniref:SLAM family member 9-like isoform X2 n=1 Tax=Petaurus breviceps papuanus TaxID=3040969 RepID=UPI0036DEE04D
MAYLLQRCLLFFLFYSLTESSASGEDSIPKMVTGILGESVILPLEIPKEKQISYIVWISQRSLAIIETGKEGKSPKIIITNPHYLGRVDFLNQSYSYAPQISHLKMEDAGSYTAEITVANITEPIKKLFTLLIHERLTEPKVTLGPRINDNGTCLVNVTCSVEQVREHVIYSWTAAGQGANASSGGPILSISWKPGDHDLYTCTARNPVSNSSHTILASELCAGIEHDISYIRVFLYLITIFILIILSLLGLSFWYIQRKKEKEADAGDQKCTIYDSIPNLRVGAVGNTEYATVSYPKKNIQKNLEAPNTVYDILQNTTKMGKSDTLEKNPRSPGTLDFGDII